MRMVFKRPGNWDALINAAARDWKGCRSETKQIAQALCIVDWFIDKGVKSYDAITTDHLTELVNDFERAKNKPSTIQHKLSILRKLGTVGLRHKPPLCTDALPAFPIRSVRTEKWWLKPDQMAVIVPWAREHVCPIFADYIEFVCWTGLRVEEAMRLRADHFMNLDTRPAMHIPGTKTSNSQGTLPLSSQAAAVAMRRIEATKGLKPLFPMNYARLRALWAPCRVKLGMKEMPTCTLRALRRTFAKIANDKGMPTEELRKYMRHASILTTQGYLNVVGGSEEEALRAYLV